MIAPHPRSGSSFSGLRIGLLGGSFNPAHEGHVAISLYAMKRLGLDQVWWLVSPQNPLKPEKTMASLSVRMEQAKKVAQHPRIIVSDLETQLGTRYTVDTLCALRRRFSATHFVWLMGADNMQQLPRWKRWPEIFKMLPVAVLRRPSYAVGSNLGKAAQRFGRTFISAAAAGTLMQQAAPAWSVLDNKLNPLSATSLRSLSE